MSKAKSPAAVHLKARGKLAALLEEYAAQLPAFFIVSGVHLGEDPGAKPVATALPGLEIAVRPADGRKCERCWNYSTEVEAFGDFPAVCERCAPVLEEIAAGQNAG